MPADILGEVGRFLDSLFGFNAGGASGNRNAENAALATPAPSGGNRPDLPPTDKKKKTGVDALTAAEIREIALYMDAAFAYVVKEVSGAIVAATYGAATPYVAGAVGAVTTLWSRLSMRDKAKIGIGDVS